MAEREWKGNTAGTPWMHRCLISILRVVPLRVIYGFAAVIVVPFYMLLARKARLSMYHFFRLRMHEKPLRAFRSTYLNFCKFAQIIIDRFYIYGGGAIDLKVDNYDEYLSLASSPGAFMIYSAHVGNYEAAGYTLVAKTKRYNALVYGGEASTVMQQRSQIFTENNIRMIPVSDDLSHLFVINNAIDDGESVSLPADRLFGSPRFLTCSFFDADAHFPFGPFFLAARRQLPAIAINVMKEGTKRYHVYVKRLRADGSTVNEQAQSLASQYAKNLEDVLKAYPTQWFNYYEFWDNNQSQ